MSIVNYQTLIYLIPLVSYAILFYIIIVRKGLVNNLKPTTDTKSYYGLALIYWLSPLFFIGLWGLLSSVFSLKNIPTPIEVGTSFINLISSGELIIEALISFKRVVVGFTFASILGVTIGLLAGSFLVVNYLIVPTNSFLRYIPPTAFIALLIVYFGVGEPYKYAVIFLGMIFFIIQMVIDVVDDVDMRYIEMGLTSGFSRWEIFRKVITPFCWPRILDVLRINLGAAWTFLVAAELVGAERGLGHLIAISQRFLRMGDLYAGILTFGIIGLITDRFIETISKRCFKWYYVELKR